VYESDHSGGGRFRIWAELCHDGRTQLKIVQGTFNAVKYRIDMLGLIVLSFLLQRNFDHVFQHDNARCQDFLNQNQIRVPPWPMLSPDLSPIEYLCDKLGRRVHHRQNPPGLRDSLVHEWNNIPQAFI
jgi:hypothetical protein